MAAEDAREPSDAAVVAASRATTRPQRPGGAPTLRVAAEAVAIATGIAICAAAPEFIWQGLGRFFGHATWLNLISALLIALVFVSFVEPLIEQARNLLTGGRGAHAGAYGPAFTLSLGLAFGLVSVCLHEAIAGFVSPEHAAEGENLREAIELAASWALVPFLVALAWQARHAGWLAVPTGILAALSPLIAGWSFGWAPASMATTALPCLVILFAGYRELARRQDQPVFVRLARLTAGIAALWLILAAIADIVLAASGHDDISPYASSDLLVDLRFYIGWALGLFFAASHEHHVLATPATEPPAAQR
ncbi:hypothetical protein [Ancylobacter terrae]|uniref:hypothetical protein n=1 Tax=Ancylobacter sp. sgz301288 TaxID=3342077 RepID=UPI00385EEB4D